MDVINDKAEFIKELVADYNKNLSTKQPKYDFNKIESHISKLNYEKEKYKAMYVNGIIDIEELKNHAEMVDKK